MTVILSLLGPITAFTTLDSKCDLQACVSNSLRVSWGQAAYLINLCTPSAQHCFSINISGINDSIKLNAYMQTSETFSRPRRVSYSSSGDNLCFDLRLKEGGMFCFVFLRKKQLILECHLLAKYSKALWLSKKRISANPC